MGLVRQRLRCLRDYNIANAVTQNRCSDAAAFDDIRERSLNQGLGSE